MARLTPLRDDRGAVYVEFLIAFCPLFLLFLALCQVALVVAAEAVVRHSAYAAVRSAVVVLEDPPERYDHADRGDVWSGNSNRVNGLNAVIGKLEIGRVNVSGWLYSLAKVAERATPQRGARMVPIRTAAYLPLLPLAPNERLAQPQQETVARSLAAVGDHQLGYAAEYTKAATQVTLHNSRDNEDPAAMPFESNSSVTVRITYLFHCTVPWVRHIMCSTIARAGGELTQTITAAKFASLVSADARFKRLTAKATLPNQGANYYPREAEQ